MKSLIPTGITKLFIVFSLLVSCQVFGTIFEKIGVKEGLPQSSVNFITQDSTGFIWMATNDGLVRYDSQHFTLYNSSSGHGLNTNAIVRIHQASNGILWVSAADGLYRYDQSNDIFIHQPLLGLPEQSKHYTRSILAIEDVGDTLWLLLGRELFSYDIHSHQLQKTQFGQSADEHDLSKVNRTRLLAGNNNQIFLFTDQKSYWLDTNTKRLEVISTESSTSANKVALTNAAVILRHDKTVEVLSLGKKWCINNAVARPCGREDDVVELLKDKTDYVPLFLEHSNGNYWFSHRGDGVFLFDQSLTLLKHYQYNQNDKQGLANNDVVRMYIDNQDNIWLINYGAGISKISARPKFFNSYTSENGTGFSLSHNHVRAFYQATDDELWVGTFSGLNRINLTTNKIEQFYIEGDGIKLYHSNFVRSIVPYSSNELLVLSGGDYQQTVLWLFNIHTHNWRAFPSPNTGSVQMSGFELIEHKGDYWLAMVGKGLYKWHPEQQQWQHPEWLPENDNPTTINQLYFDKLDRLWIADMAHGALVYDFNQQTLNRYDTKSATLKLNGQWAKSFLHDSKGNIWIGSTNGLHRINESKQTLSLFTTENGLTNNTIYGMLEDADGYLWLSTNKGLNRFDPSDNSFTHFDIADGLQGLEFNTRAFHQYKGHFSFGGIHGFNQFTPTQFTQINTSKVPLVITDITLLNQPLTVHQPADDVALEQPPHLLEELSIPSHYQVFSVDFTTLDFQETAKLSYQYRLTGLYDDWINVNNNRATFTGLTSGRYLLQIRAIKNNIDHAIAQTELIINITPPWWRTSVAYVIYVVIILMTLSSLYWRRMRYLQRQAQQLQTAVDEKTQALQQALKEKDEIFDQVSHEFRTPLTLIEGPAQDIINDNQQSTAAKSAQTILTQSRFLLRLVNQLLGLNVAGESSKGNACDIAALCQHIVQRFSADWHKRNIKFTQHITPEIQCELSNQEIEIVLSNLLSNASKFTPDNGEINLTIFAQAQQVIIQLDDSGPGLSNEDKSQVWQKFYRGNNSQSHQGTGLGLSLIAKITDKYQGATQVSDSPMGGCRFTVSLPLVSGEHNELKQNLLSQVPYAQELETTASMTEADIAQLDKGEQHQTTLLIVEDNLSLMAYLVGKLSQHYHCITAFDGQQALDVTQQQQVDIIVSDVMMPNLSGTQLCQKLKSSMATSHIPIVLLTAKSDQQSKLEGLSQRANAYISKPFDFNELQITLDNLLAEKQQISQFILTGQKAKATVVSSIASAEQAFIDKLHQVVENNYQEASFQSAQLAQAMALSERQLQRKLLATTQKTPTQFIRQWRLTASQKLLLSGHPVGNVALDCGFSSQAYFSKCFKEVFAQTPSQFVNQQTSQPQEISE